LAINDLTISFENWLIKQASSILRGSIYLNRVTIQGFRTRLSEPAA